MQTADEADSTGSDWLAASPASRRSFIEEACWACATGGRGACPMEMVLEGVNAFFEIPGLRGHTISFAFGEIYAAQLRFGYFHDHLERLASPGCGARIDRFSDGHGSSAELQIDGFVAGTAPG